MKNVIRNSIGAGILGLALAAGVGCSTDQVISGIVDEVKPEVIAVQMYADWDSGSKRLSQRISSARDNLDGRKVQWVKADITDRTNPVGKRTLEKMGLGEIFARYGGKPGIIVLVDADTNEVLKVVPSGGATKETITRDVRDALALVD